MLRCLFMNNDDLKILDKKINEFNKLYKDYKTNNKIDELELKEIIYDILNHFEICLKGVNNLNKEDIKIISAIKYANNIKKHSKSIFDHTLKTLALYPSDNLYPSDSLYPSEFKIWWNDLPLDSSKYVLQYKNYNNYLKNKDVYKTINEIYKIIKINYT